MNVEDLKIYLPKYLSAEADEKLFEGLKDFPNNIDERLYTSYLQPEKVIYQGDGLREMLVVNLPDTKTNAVSCIVFSNTCDIDSNNNRNFPSQIVYAPIFNLNKYRNSLIKKSTKTEKQVDNHINAIKKQRITQIFYLPKFEKKLEESIVFLDRLNNITINSIKKESIINRRIFTLSDYGAYLFLFKISLHFTRIQDEVERKDID